MRRWLKRLVVTAVVVVVVMQLIPYGWWHENPAVVADAPWPDEETASLARQACYSCHSNETEWPVYSYVAPMSWLVRRDVEAGRDAFNFSEWDEYGDDAGDAAEALADGEMPPSRYTVIHPEADLSDAEVAQLLAALEALDGGNSGSGNSGSGDSGEDNSGEDNSGEDNSGHG